MIGLGVSGERVKGKGDPVRPDDAWHIGSNTKMLTALAWARLVEAGPARWGMTVGEVFESEKIAAGWRDVTIEELLAHRSGAAANPGWLWMIASLTSRKPAAEQRAKLVSETLAKAPSSRKRGTFVYSNLGYTIVGRAIERVSAKATGQEAAYETLLGELVVETAPGGPATSLGFGPPSRIEGHKRGMFGGYKPAGRGRSADNPVAIAPAGTAHVNLADHARLLLPFLEGPDALPQAIRAKLLAPYPDASSEYALGWGIASHETAGRIYVHNGSNSMWLSRVAMAPDIGVVIIANTNQFNDAAQAALRELTDDLLTRLETERRP